MNAFKGSGIHYAALECDVFAAAIRRCVWDRAADERREVDHREEMKTEKTDESILAYRGECLNLEYECGWER